MGATGTVPDEALAHTARRLTTPCGDGGMVWRCWGAGPTLVLLHGGGGGWQHWMRTIPALMPFCAVWAPDLPGLGESDLPADPQSADGIADTVAAGLRVILPAGGQCDLVGFSFGSVIGSHLATRHQDLVRSLTLVGPGGLGMPRGPTPLRKVRHLQGAEREDAHRANLLSLMIADPAKIDGEALRIQDEVTRGSRIVSPAISAQPLVREALACTTMPIGVIWGERDAPASADLPGRIALIETLRPGAPVAVIPGAGHWVAFEAADRFNDVLLGLLRRYGGLRPAA